MAQSINTTVEYTGKGRSYLSMGSNVGSFLIGDKGFEFYNDNNVERFIQIPWESIDKIGANVTRQKHISRHFEVYTDKGKFLFASSDSGKILKIARDHLGDEKVVKLPTLLQTIAHWIRTRFAKKK